MSKQFEFTFEPGEQDAGYEDWLAKRRAAAERLGRALGLPILRKVEVWLKGEVRLRGILKPKEELVFADPERAQDVLLVVDGVTFTTGEITSCIRLD